MSNQAPVFGGRRANHPFCVVECFLQAPTQMDVWDNVKCCAEEAENLSELGAELDSDSSNRFLPVGSQVCLSAPSL